MKLYRMSYFEHIYFYENFGSEFFLLATDDQDGKERCHEEEGDRELDDVLVVGGHFYVGDDAPEQETGSVHNMILVADTMFS